MLSSFSLSDFSLYGLHSASKLEDLSLLGCTFGPEAFKSLQALPLTLLNLSYSEVREDCLKAVWSLPFTSLVLRQTSTGLTDSCLDTLRGMAQLTMLDLSGSKNRISDSGLKSLQGLPSLRALCLQDWVPSRSLSAGGFSAFRRLPLTSLDLSDPEGCQGFVDDDFLWQLRGLPLTSLNLAGCSCLSDYGMEALKGLPLTSLSLRGVGYDVTDEGVRFLEGMKLVSVELSAGCSDDGIIALWGMPVTSLSLWGCDKISDIGLGYLCGIPVTSLDLSGCDAVTDEGLLNLMKLPQLKSLYLGSKRLIVAPHVTPSLKCAGIDIGFSVE